MSWFRRIGFFVALNILVVITLSFLTSILGVGRYATSAGIDYGSLIGFCLVWGMGGAFISLLLSKVMAKWMMGVKVIDPNTSDPSMRSLVNLVHRLAQEAGLRTMPEVGIYESPEVNAFATGPTRNHSLVAISSGILGAMDRESLEGVLGHEISHIANGDMVTMTLLQGVVNAFVMALARIIAFAIENAMRGDRDSGRGGGLGFAYPFVVMALELVLFIPGSMLISWYSRQREFRADAGGARLAGPQKMIAALRDLQRVTALSMFADAPSAPDMAAFKIARTKRRNSLELFSTHPPLEERIARLQALR